MPSNHQCSPEKAMQIFRGHDFWALLDVREKAEFLQKHQLQASCAPLSKLEFMAPLLVPCKTSLVVLVDSGDSDDFRAQKAAEVLRDMGYTRLEVMDGGMRGWEKAGYITVVGACFLAKGYAEYLEQEKNTPGLTPEDVRKRLERGEKVVLVDIRVPGEFTGMSLPGGINAPGCEAAYRFLDLAPSPDTLVVVNCAARTRGILCAQMLKDFGVPNPVASLRGGTMNWRRSGYKLEHGLKQRTAPPSERALRFALERAEALAEKYNIGFVDADTLRAWQGKAETEPLYVFDVRQPEEYEAGHLAGSQNAPGGQLTQCFNEYAAVRGARFALVDDTEARAVITAYWLKQMGAPDVYVLKGGLGGSGLGKDGLETGPAPQPVVECGHHNGMGAETLLKRIANQAAPLVINVGYSNTHRKGHVPGAAWVTRARLERVREKHPEAREIVLTADCETHARLAAADAQKLWPEAVVCFLEGATPGWEKKNLPMEEGMPEAFSPEDDIWYLMYTDPNASLDSMEEFFDWKNELAAQMLRDGSFDFRLP